MFLAYSFFVIPGPVRKNGTTNNEKPPLTLANTAFSALVPHVSRMLCFLSVLFGCLSVSRGCSFSCFFETWYGSPVQLACFSKIFHHFTRLTFGQSIFVSRDGVM